MSKFVLTLDTTNRPTWGAREGIREALQNARDATIEHSATLDVRFRKETSTLVIENDGCKIPLKALLIGFSTKREDRRLAGHYGEGLPFGILALVRDGHAVKIRTGSEVWTAFIEPHDQVGQPVLAFDIKGDRKDENRVQFEIGNVSEDTFKALPEHFLFLSKDKSDRIETDSGTLLLGEKYRGNVYVKGIFVCHDPKLNFGYDFQNAETDSERKMLASYELENHCRYVWQKAAATRPDLMRKFIDLLMGEEKDVQGVEPWNALYMPEEIKTAVAADFLERHGENAVPVQSLADSAEIGHLGKTGIIVSKPQRAILEAVLGTVQQRKERLREEPQKLYGWHELSAMETRNLTNAVALLDAVLPTPALHPTLLSQIDVTDFRDEKIRGLFRDGRIILAKRILSERDLTRRVLVHEVAHRNGGDGEKEHVAEIERIHTAIEEHLLDIK